jgi:hypothetical protein
MSSNFLKNNFYDNKQIESFLKKFNKTLNFLKQNYYCKFILDNSSWWVFSLSVKSIRTFFEFLRTFSKIGETINWVQWVVRWFCAIVKV